MPDNRLPLFLTTADEACSDIARPLAATPPSDSHASWPQQGIGQPTASKVKTTQVIRHNETDVGSHEVCCDSLLGQSAANAS
jgi:hypothetical protein